MATILLSSVGSLFGPFGQIAGTLAGSAIDHALFGPQDRHGPRLKELAVTGSSYGTPIARHYGTMRSGGSIVWAADLTEHREREGGGKGQPKTVRYSYSASFAVALSSRPIERIGRIWAGGSLLRGKAGDLKAGGQLRVYNGHGDQPCDPLMEAALGAQCPAFRGLAYAVFEDLDLTDFGNRIPPLSFEIFAGAGSRMVELLLEDCGAGSARGVRLGELRGFAHEAGSVREVLQLVDRLWPLTVSTGEEGCAVRLASSGEEPVCALPPAVRWDEGDFGQLDGTSISRPTSGAGQLSALRYYDPARDFQPGLQYAGTVDDSSRTLQFPGVFDAGDALSLARRANVRARAAGERLQWRCSDLDPQLSPGAIVTAPGHSGLFQLLAREWRDGGVELELARHRPAEPVTAPPAADPGSAWAPVDRLPSQTVLRVFETPWNGVGNPAARVVYAAPCAPAGRWPGCTLYTVEDGAMVPLDIAAQERALCGQLVAPLAPSRALRFEPDASLIVQLIDHEASLISTDLRGIGRNENLLALGGEVLQFAQAIPLGLGQWQLTGLLRGRGGTERAAATGHPAGRAATMLDDRLLSLTSATLDPGSIRFAAIGPADDEAAFAALENGGASLRPLSPVHPRMQVMEDGALLLSWTRRARGQWGWPDHVDLPLVEESEGYEVVFGPSDAPLRRWTTSQPSLALPAGELASLTATLPGGLFYVRQIGTYDRSAPLELGRPA